MITGQRRSGVEIQDQGGAIDSASELIIQVAALGMEMIGVVDPAGEDNGLISGRDDERAESGPCLGDGFVGLDASRAFAGVFEPADGGPDLRVTLGRLAESGQATDGQEGEGRREELATGGMHDENLENESARIVQE
jgi:hypothetical protein